MLGVAPRDIAGDVELPGALRVGAGDGAALVVGVGLGCALVVVLVGGAGRVVGWAVGTVVVGDGAGLVVGDVDTDGAGLVGTPAGKACAGAAAQHNATAALSAAAATRARSTVDRRSEEVWSHSQNRRIGPRLESTGGSWRGDGLESPERLII